ncbi:hypothetical protein BC835DRAFT_1396618 [Cytidiella melzeri]|nr:hypothetical protein BC835DRAFT_1396603 [Cytidiella melzeri]KAI0683178.1 hypothetical protein BC835DRAFT_1396618 [Cytidiella melzeri]
MQFSTSLIMLATIVTSAFWMVPVSATPYGTGACRGSCNLVGRSDSSKKPFDISTLSMPFDTDILWRQLGTSRVEVQAFRKETVKRLLEGGSMPAHLTIIQQGIWGGLQRKMNEFRAKIIKGESMPADLSNLEKGMWEELDWQVYLQRLSKLIEKK